MNALERIERERSKLQNRRKIYEDHLKNDQTIQDQLMKSKDKADLKLELAKTKLLKFYNGEYTFNTSSTNSINKTNTSLIKKQILPRPTTDNLTEGEIKNIDNSNEQVLEVFNDLNMQYENTFPKGHPFIVACQFGRINDVIKYIQTGCIDINQVNGKNSKGRNDGYTGLMTAVEEEHYELVKFFLEIPSIDISVVREGYGVNALHVAAKSNRNSLDILNLLLAHKTCTHEVINKKTDDCLGHTPTDYAYSNVSQIRKEITKLIKSKGGKTTRQLEKEACKSI